MKKRLFVAVVLALIALPVMSALAGNIFRLSGRNADAFFFSTDGVCIDTFVFAVADDGRFQSPPGPGNTSSGAFVEVAQFDFCNGVLLLDAFGSVSLADPDFQINRALTSATLNASIPAFDIVSGLDVVVDVDLTWTGTGALTRGNSHSHFQSPGFIVNSHFNGTSRPAQASGSVSIGGTNFTPDPSVGGEMRSSKFGEVVID